MPRKECSGIAGAAFTRRKVNNKNLEGWAVSVAQGTKTDAKAAKVNMTPVFTRAAIVEDYVRHLAIPLAGVLSDADQGLVTDAHLQATGHHGSRRSQRRGSPYHRSHQRGNLGRNEPGTSST